MLHSRDMEHFWSSKLAEIVQIGTKKTSPLQVTKSSGEVRNGVLRGLHGLYPHGKINLDEKYFFIISKNYFEKNNIFSKIKKKHISKKIKKFPENFHIFKRKIPEILDFFVEIFGIFWFSKKHIFFQNKFSPWWKNIFHKNLFFREGTTHGAHVEHRCGPPQSFWWSVLVRFFCVPISTISAVPGGQKRSISREWSKSLLQIFCMFKHTPSRRSGEIFSSIAGGEGINLAWNHLPMRTTAACRLRGGWTTAGWGQTSVF